MHRIQRTGNAHGTHVQAVLLEFPFQQADGQGGAVYGPAQFRPDIRHGANVILVTMGEDRADDAVPVGFQKSGIGNDQINAGGLAGGKGDAAIHQQQLAVEIVGHHVHADFAEAAQGDDVQLFVVFRRAQDGSSSASSETSRKCRFFSIMRPPMMEIS